MSTTSHVLFWMWKKVKSRFESWPPTNPVFTISTCICWIVFAYVCLSFILCPVSLLLFFFFPSFLVSQLSSCVYLGIQALCFCLCVDLCSFVSLHFFSGCKIQTVETAEPAEAKVRPWSFFGSIFMIFLMEMHLAASICCFENGHQCTGIFRTGVDSEESRMCMTTGTGMWWNFSKNPP